jgi:formylmethanofuran dehydrogenase subunit E
MGGKASTRFIQSRNYRQITYSDANIRFQNEYGVSCMYCNEYFPNIKKSRDKHICKECYSNARIG